MTNTLVFEVKNERFIAVGNTGNIDEISIAIQKLEQLRRDLRERLSAIAVEIPEHVDYAQVVSARELSAFGARHKYKMHAATRLWSAICPVGNSEVTLRVLATPDSAKLKAIRGLGLTSRNLLRDFLRSRGSDIGAAFVKDL